MNVSAFNGYIQLNYAKQLISKLFRAKRLYWIEDAKAFVSVLEPDINAWGFQISSMKNDKTYCPLVEFFRFFESQVDVHFKDVCQWN